MTEQNKFKNMRFSYDRESGFSIIEVILTLGILATLVMAVSMIMRSSFDIRFSLSEDAKASHRLSAAIQKISSDLEHAFIVSTKDLDRGPTTRTTKTLFSIESRTGADKLMLTTMNHRAMEKGQSESDQAFIVWELKQDDKGSGLKHLYRGETTTLPEDFQDEPKLRCVAKYIKSFQVTPWNGERFVRETWNSNRSDYRNLLPTMVKIEILGLPEEPLDGASESEVKDEMLVKYSTVVYLPTSFGMKEPKDPTGTLRWY